MDAQKSTLNAKTLAETIKAIASSLREESNRVSAMFTPLSGFCWNVCNQLDTLSLALETDEQSRLSQHLGPMATKMRLDAHTQALKARYVTPVQHDPWDLNHIESTIAEMAPYSYCGGQQLDAWRNTVTAAFPKVEESYQKYVFAHYFLSANAFPEKYTRSTHFSNSQVTEDTVALTSANLNNNGIALNGRMEYDVQITLPKLRSEAIWEKAQQRHDWEGIGPNDTYVDEPLYSYTKVRIKLTIETCKMQSSVNETDASTTDAYVTEARAYIADIWVQDALEGIHYDGIAGNVDKALLKRRFESIYSEAFGLSDEALSRMESADLKPVLYEVDFTEPATAFTEQACRYYQELLDLGDITPLFADQLAEGNGIWYNRPHPHLQKSCYTERMSPEHYYETNEDGGLPEAVTRMGPHFEFTFKVADNAYVAVIRRSKLTVTARNGNRFAIDRMGLEFILKTMIDQRRALMKALSQVPFDWKNTEYFVDRLTALW